MNVTTQGHTWLLLAAVLILQFGTASCGSSSPTSPSPSSPQPATTSVPQPPFPSLRGGWRGTYTIVADSPTLGNISNMCTVTSQTQGSFSGRWSISGGTTTSCAQSGRLNGTVTRARNVTMTHAVQIGNNPNCTRTGGSNIFRGVLSGTNISVTTSDRISCTTGSSTATARRSLTLSLNRQ